MNQDFWQKQARDKPLFPDIEWSKPQQKAQRGKLLIVGGTTNGFTSVVKSFSAAYDAGAGEIKVAVPDKLKKNLPANFSDGIFLPTNPSGAPSKEGEQALIAAGEWATGILLVGDSGQNSETAILYDKLLDSTDKWVTITRDAVDLVRSSGEKLVNRPNTNLIMNFAQTQKLFSQVFYPRVLTFSMQFISFVDALHKFTITYPVTLTVLLSNNIIVASGGKVITQEFSDQMSLINGTLAAKSATYLLWTPQKPLETIASSW